MAGFRRSIDAGAMMETTTAADAASLECPRYFVKPYY